jgi:hypothetical protein
VRVDSDEELLRPEARLQDGHRQDSRWAVQVGLDVAKIKTRQIRS